MAKQSDFLLLAVECGRLMGLSVDAQQRHRYKQLRDSWIALAFIEADIARVEEAVFDQGKTQSIH